LEEHAARVEVVQHAAHEVALSHLRYAAYRTDMDIVELRRYTLKPGRREDLIELFEREFVPAQQACGITLLGVYRNLDDPQSFVWLRSFQTMEQRRTALEAFYERSDAWARNRDAANDTMIDSDNVLLLRPARADTGLRINRESTPFTAISVTMLAEPASEAFIAEFEDSVLPQLRQNARNIAYFVTEPAPNTYPRLPVREGEWAFVACGDCATRDAMEEWHSAWRATESLRLASSGGRR
jgi:NIPSNAP